MNATRRPWTSWSRAFTRRTRAIRPSDSCAAFRKTHSQERRTGGCARCRTIPTRHRGAGRTSKTFTEKRRELRSTERRSARIGSYEFQISTYRFRFREKEGSRIRTARPCSAWLHVHGVTDRDGDHLDHGRRRNPEIPRPFAPRERDRSDE